MPVAMKWHVDKTSLYVCTHARTHIHTHTHTLYIYIHINTLQSHKVQVVTHTKLKL